MLLKPLPKPTGPAPLTAPAKPVPSLGPKELLPVWTSEGVAGKPPGCKECPFRLSGTGFVADWFPDEDKAPRLGFLLDFPNSDDVISRRPWSGKAGYAWEKAYLAPFGLCLQDVMISHVLRCQPKEQRFGKKLYPIAGMRRGAEMSCRQHDKVCWGGPVERTGGIHSFEPDTFVVTFHPREALAVPALSHLILADIKKAVKKMEAGRRVLVLMGDEAKDLVAPWLRGSVKSWRGHHWQGCWPWKEGSALVEPELGFISI